MSNAICFQCVECGRAHRLTEVEYVCTACGGNLNVLYDYDRVASEFSASLSSDHSFSMWRYRALLPIERDSPVPPLAIGWTPVYECPRIAAELGVREILIKDDGRNPTASLKDRPSAVAVVKAQEAGAQVITTASSGNAGSALAGVCASVGMKSVIFVPAFAPPAKVAQLQVYGATVVVVDGSYDEAFSLCLEASTRFGWYQRSTGYNPFTREGKKTAALEIAEQLRWRVPDKLFVAMGDGNIISGLWKGFDDLLMLGLIDRMPQLMGVQAEGAAAIVNAANGDGVVRAGPAHTIADSINVGKPNDGTMAVMAIRESGGQGLTVTDEEMIAAVVRLARSTGVFVEPAAGAAFAGLVKQGESGLIKSDESVLVLLTGNGLKDIDSARKAVEPPIRISPDIDELARALDRRQLTSRA
jgi:threonine synthase